MGNAHQTFAAHKRVKLNTLSPATDALVPWCAQGSTTTVQRPLFGPPASMQPGPTGQVYVQGQPYYMEA